MSNPCDRPRTADGPIVDRLRRRHHRCYHLRFSHLDVDVVVITNVIFKNDDLTLFRTAAIDAMDRDDDDEMVHVVSENSFSRVRARFSRACRANKARVRCVRYVAACLLYLLCWCVLR